MTLTFAGVIAIASALAAILMVGSRHLRTNLLLYSVQTFLVCLLTIMISMHKDEHGLFFVGIAVASIKAIGIPSAFLWIIKRIDVQSDSGTMLPAPLAMHLCILLLGLSKILTSGLPVPVISGESSMEATAALSLLFTGMVVMLTRKVALSQIVGFLTMENGIFLFALTQTSGMPMIIEMGILLDVLVGVMIGGLLLFRIKTSFEQFDKRFVVDLVKSERCRKCSHRY